ncbi:type 1 glutamine amidotransferase [Sulfitobacter sp. F26169L]|uniref:type 1 glutamine amidotransferase n=1 Tax=Sulfitobacter sp. F26169L TaxID=2996015 RepID=UPI002260D158|nr:type 1 glutamine amidotransferase [Sulfitobacter sp. F26169L]MCX7564879.1 type 1 glutamine amidotransferase [Sulfitobacter sp. F26169L]
MKIGILRTGHSPEELIDKLGNYDTMFERLLAGHGFTFQTFSVVDGEFPEGVQDADGWLITGSKHGAYEDHAWIPPLEDLIREIHAAGKPLVGVCFGHQIIAQAMGGKVEKFKGGWSVGRVNYMLDGQPVALNAWHQDQVTVLPEGARVIGQSDFCKYAMLAYDDTIWTIQPHPEFSPEFIDGLIRTRGKGVVPDAHLEAATTTLSLPVDSANIATQMAQFFKSKARA